MVDVLWQKLAREFWERKLALSSLAVTLAVGVAFFSGFMTTYLSLDRARAQFYQDYRLADFSLRCKRCPEWAIRRAVGLEGVTDLRGRVQLSVRLEMDEPLTATALSLPREGQTDAINGVMLVKGSLPGGSNQRQVLVNDAFARARGVNPGQRLRVIIEGGSYDFLVVGTVMSPEYVYALPPGGSLAPDPARSPILFFEERFLQQAAGMVGAYNEILGTTTRPGDAQQAREILQILEEQLQPYGVLLSIPQEEQSSVHFLANELMELRVNAVWLPGVCLGVVAMVLHVVLHRTVAQQRTILGTLRALGYTRWALRRHYLSYGLVLGLVGGGAGLWLGRALQQALLGLYRHFYEMPSIEARSEPVMMAVAWGVGLAFALAGAWAGTARGVNLEPAEAMRPPGPEKVQPLALERLTWLWQGLPFQARMVSRAVLRNPFRSLVTITASFVATSLLVETLTMMASVNHLVEYEFRSTAHHDVRLGLREVVDRLRALEEVQGLVGVDRCEAQLHVTCDLISAQASKRVSVTGLSPGQQLFTPLDRNGQPLQIPSRGLLISRKLAEILQLGLGDRLRLKALQGRRQQREVQITGIVDTYLGLSAYTDIDYLSELIGEDRVTNNLVLTTSSGMPSVRLLEQLRARPMVLGLELRREALEKIQATLDRALGTSLGILVIFSGLLAFGSILNTALVSLGERQREVGTLRVLGYTAREVFVIFAAESILLNGMGVCLGLAGGIGFAHLVSQAYNTELFRLPVVVSPPLLGQAALLMLVFLASAQLIVAHLVRQMVWLDVFKVRE